MSPWSFEISAEYWPLVVDHQAEVLQTAEQDGVAGLLDLLASLGLPPDAVTVTHGPESG